MCVGLGFAWMCVVAAEMFAFVKVLVSRPRLMLLDEPFGSLDIHTRENLQEEIGHILKSLGTTVIMITHDIAEAVFMANRIEIISPSGGKIISEHEIPVERPSYRAFRHSMEYRRFMDSLWKQINTR